MPLAAIFMAPSWVVGPRSACPAGGSRVYCAARRPPRPRSLAGGRARADLVVRAVAAHLVRGRRLKAPGADARGGGGDGGGRGGEVGLGRAMAADQGRLDEAGLDAPR